MRAYLDGCESPRVQSAQSLKLVERRLRLGDCCHLAFFWSVSDSGKDFK